MIDGPGSMISMNGSCVDPCPPSFSTLGVGSFATIGAGEGQGFLSVLNGGKLMIDSTDAPSHRFVGITLGGSTILGPKGDGTMLVEGAGSLVSITGNEPFFSIGRLEEGTGSLTIRNGGSVVMEDVSGEGSFVVVADRIGATGSVTIEGAGSLFDTGGTLGIGVDDRDTAISSGSGVVTLADGGMLLADTIIVGAQGALIGEGSVKGSNGANTTIVQQGGIVAPGFSPGTLSFDGDLILDGGTLRLEAFGPDALDRIEVAGDLILGSGAVELLLAFTPAPGEALELIFVEGDVIDQGFDLDQIVVLAVAGSGVKVGQTFALAFGSEEFMVAVSAIAAIPLPATLWLMIGGLGGLAMFRRRGERPDATRANLVAAASFRT